MSGTSKSEPSSVEPWLGLVTEYASNPHLQVGGPSESDAAILFHAPLRYDIDPLHFALLPSVRYSDSGTYASIDSNSFHLDGKAQYLTDLGSLALTAGAGRDSSLYFNGLTSNGTGVRTDTAQVSIEWQKVITPRVTSDFDVAGSRAQYDQRAESSGLIDYRYLSAAESFIYASSERNTLSLIPNFGLYKTTDGTTESKTVGLQVGFDRQLSEIWTLSASGGYSKSEDSVDEFIGPYLVATAESTQKSPIFKASLARKGELLNVTATVSRALIPSGFAFLSKQDLAQVGLHYTRTERWAFAGSVTYQREQDPGSNGAFASRTFFSFEASATYQWTEHWLITMSANKVNENYEALGLSVASSGISMQISRQFARIDL